MKYYKKLVGEKVYLSPINVEDAEKYTEWCSDFSTTDGLGTTTTIYTIQGEKEWLEKNSTSDHCNFAIVDLETDELIGNCGLIEIDQIHRKAEVALFIGKEENRSKGCGTDVINLLLDYGFNYLNMHNIELCVYSFNKRAINCYKKIGFKEYGRRRECVFLNGKYYDCIYMDMLESEFNKDYIKNKVSYED